MLTASVASAGGSPAVTVVPPRRVIATADSSARADPAISSTTSHPPVSARTRSTASGPAWTRSVAPRSPASASLSALKSTAITRDAPAAIAPSTAASPTPPSPTTATDCPARTPAVFTTAPTPVSTAQPNSAASCNGRSRSTLTSDRRETTAWVAKAEQPRWWRMGPEPSCSRICPPSSVPAPLAAPPGAQSAGRPSAQGRHPPQLGMNTMTT